MEKGEVFVDRTPRSPAPGTLGSTLTQVDGFGRLRRDYRAGLQIRVAECAEVWSQFKAGKVSPLLMQEAFNPSDDFAFHKLNRLAPHIFTQEAMTRADFLNLTTYVLDRIMMENYPMLPSSYDQICYVKSDIRDFRTVERWVT